MSEPFLGEIKLMSFHLPPKGWAVCDGQLLPINQNQALFALLGTYYGGDGRTTFALPDLRGRVPIHFTDYQVGQRGGAESHTLSGRQLPEHNHSVQASSASANTPLPAGAAPGAGVEAYAAPVQLVPLRADTVRASGGSQAHPNMQPYLVLNFCIALQGIFPSRN